MAPELDDRRDPVDRHLDAALEAAEDEDARYHLREALQLRIAEKQTGDATTETPVRR